MDRNFQAEITRDIVQYRLLDENILVVVGCNINK